MQNTRKIWIVDAFTNKPYTGNPAGVMIVLDFPEDAQSIAAEMNLSETAFVKSLDDDRFTIRFFTPLVEVKLCGHATLATAHVLFQENLVQGDQITFESLLGLVSVIREKDGLVLDFPLQKTKEQLDVSVFKDALNIKSDDIVEAVQAQNNVIVLLQDESMVKQLKPDFAKIVKIDVHGVIVTAAGSAYDCVSRFFVPRIGINEDPVTGMAHCALADYWSQKLQKTTLRAYQASARGGELHLQVQDDRVLLKGQAVTIMEGLWKV